MADTFNPSIPPQENANGTFRHRVRKIQYGDGYVQRAKDGFNNRTQTWSFTWVGTNAEIEPIKEFLEDHDGYVSFYYTPPMSAVPRLFVCEDFQLVPAAASNATLTATFIESFVP
jgi:phage-related protein